MYQANEHRYEKMSYRRVANTGLVLPAVSLGLWRGFGDERPLSNTRKVLLDAFDSGINHFDLANNYGPKPGSAESSFGAVFQSDLKPYRDEMIVSSKAGFDMWQGPYGSMSSKKHLVASMDQSLKRTGLDYFDIFYTHRPDEQTSFEETADTLDLFVKQGKALYIGISNYSKEQTEKMIRLFKERHTPFVIHQVSYNMLNREAEEGLLDVLQENKLGAIAYGPLAEGLLTDRSSQKIPADFPAHRTNSSLLAPEKIASTQQKLRSLKKIADAREQTLSQLALAWLLKDPTVASVVIGSTNIDHVHDNLAALQHLEFSQSELNEIKTILHS
ncbi:aldo/keto reductase [Enterococcus devriesei]|uniref:aldo/keto reductase n=1 Tax=Enterococcus devriesei TaxID=319970 RepID=UPI0036D41D8B